MFINFNISVLVPLFPAKGSITIPFLHGLFSASGGMLLIMKLIYVGTEAAIGLKDMATFYACGTIIMHVQTVRISLTGFLMQRTIQFLFTPFKTIPMGTNLRFYNVYHDVS